MENSGRNVDTKPGPVGCSSSNLTRMFPGCNPAPNTLHFHDNSRGASVQSEAYLLSNKKWRGLGDHDLNVPLTTAVSRFSILTGQVCSQTSLLYFFTRKNPRVECTMCNKNELFLNSTGVRGGNSSDSATVKLPQKDSPCRYSSHPIGATVCLLC